MRIESITKTPEGNGYELWDVHVDAPEVQDRLRLAVSDAALRHEGIMALFVPEVVGNEGGVVRLRVFPMPAAQIASADPYPLHPVKPAKVSSADVDQGVHQLVAAEGKFATDTRRRTPAVGDTVVVSMQARSNGRRVTDLTFVNRRVRVGSDAVPGKISALLISMYVGQTKSCSLGKGWSVDGRAGDEGRAEACEVRVSLNDLLRIKAPELTDAWVSEHMPRARTVEGLRRIVKKDLEEQARAHAHDELLEQAAAQLAGRVTSFPPENAVAAMAEVSFSGLMQQIHSGGYTLTEFLTSEGVTENQLRSMIHQQASSELTLSMALDALARENKLEPEEADFEQAARKLGQTFTEDARSTLISAMGEVYATELARRARANEWLLERQGLGR